jgi:hypothetical protein
MSDRLRGRFFIFSKEKTEKIKGLLESKIEGMSTLGINSIIPIIKFKKDKFLPLNTLKVLFNLSLFLLLAHMLISMKWIKRYLKKEKRNFTELFVKFVTIKELVINGEEEDFKCLCVYFTLGKKLIGVISYSYRQKEQ